MEQTQYNILVFLKDISRLLNSKPIAYCSRSSEAGPKQSLGSPLPQALCLCAAGHAHLVLPV